MIAQHYIVVKGHKCHCSEIAFGDKHVRHKIPQNLNKTLHVTSFVVGMPTCSNSRHIAQRWLFIFILVMILKVCDLEISCIASKNPIFLTLKCGTFLSPNVDNRYSIDFSHSYTFI